MSLSLKSPSQILVRYSVRLRGAAPPTLSAGKPHRPFGARPRSDASDPLRAVKCCTIAGRAPFKRLDDGRYGPLPREDRPRADISHGDGKRLIGTGGGRHPCGCVSVHRAEGTTARREFAEPNHPVGMVGIPGQPAARRSQSCSNGFRRSTPSWSKSRTLRVTTVSRCTKAVAAIMASSSRVSERRCLSRAHARNVSAFMGSTL